MQRTLFVDVLAYTGAANNILDSSRAVAGGPLSGFQIFEAFTYGLFIPFTEKYRCAIAKLGSTKQTGPFVRVAAADMYRLKLAAEAKRNFSGGEQAPKCFVRRRNNMCFNFFDIESALTDKYARMVLGLLIAPGLYGGLHLLAWNGPFRSTVETTLWQMSALVVTTTGWVVLPAIALLGADPDFIPELPSLLKRTSIVHIFGACLLPYPLGAFWMSIPLYILARTFLVVESLIQLAYLPSSTFEEVQWSRYFPHIV